MSSKDLFLVLGANSFSGASFVKFLLDRKINVIATSRSPQPHQALLPYAWGRDLTKVEFHLIDLNHDLEKLRTIIEKKNPRYVVNFAAQSMVGQSWEFPQDWMNTNVLGTLNLFDLLRRHSGLKKYVHVTTPEVYGSTEGWIEENDHYRPSTPYAVSRAASDMVLRTYVDQYNFPAVSTRAANVYGPGQQLYRIIPRTILAAMTGKKLVLDGGGSSTRVFIHMDDVSDATFRVAQSGSVGECYHISGNELISIADCVKQIVSSLNKSFEDCVVTGPERAGKDTTYMLNSNKIRSSLGWSDKINLNEGIKETIEWMERFKHAFSELPTNYVHKK